MDLEAISRKVDKALKLAKAFRVYQNDLETGLVLCLRLLEGMKYDGYGVPIQYPTVAALEDMKTGIRKLLKRFKKKGIA